MPIFWRYYGQIWQNMGLIIILGENNFTSQFYVKRVAIPEKAVLLTHSRQKMAIFGHIWPHLAKYEFNYNFWRG